MKKISGLFILGLIIGTLALIVPAQSFRATLVGRITDSAGASLPGANITVTQNGTNFTRTAATNGDGEYVVSELQPGSYTVKVDAAGFKTTINQNLVLETDRTRRFDVGLDVGSVNESVTVEAEPPTINSETPEKGEVITQRQVQELPLNVRDFKDLAKLVPGIYDRPSEDDQGQGVSSAGTRTDSTNFILDGVANRSDRNGDVGVNTSVDAIQEFKVSTSTYSAELGRVAGAQISVVSKSGTNRFSGTAFEFIRNEFFDAQNALAGPDDKKVLKRHQFGGTFGGPLPFFRFGDGGGLFETGRDKTFFFLSYEQQREKRSIFANSTAPNAAWIDGDFRNAGIDIRCHSRNNTTGVVTKVVCPTPNVIPQTNVVVGGSTILGISPAARQMASYMPVANVAGSLTGYQYSVVQKRFDPRHLFSAKIDRKITDQNNLYFRLGIDNRDGYQAAPGGRPLYPGFGRNEEYRQSSYAIGDTHSFRPTIINEFRIGYMTLDNRTINENNDADYVAQLGLLGLPTAHDPAWWGFPAIRIDGFPDTGDSANTPFNYKYKNWSIYDSVTWIAGNHSLKFGFEAVRPNYIENDIRNVRGDYRFRGRYTNTQNAGSTGIRSFADFIYGVPDTTQRQVGAIPANLSVWQSAFYIQDNWRVAPWLTLNLGLRYDYTPFLREKDNRLSNFIPELGFTYCGTGDVYHPSTGTLLCRDAAPLNLPGSLVKTDTNNWAPRFGFALKPFGNDRTVIRGGAGIFYSTESINPARQQLANNYPYIERADFRRTNTSQIRQLTFEDGFSAVETLQGVNEPQGIPIDSQTPEVYQYNLTFEHELVKDLAIEIGYVGSQARFLGMRYNPNYEYPTGEILPGGQPRTARAYSTAYGNISYQIQGVNSNYNALQAVIRRRSKNGLTLLASYTFGKAMDQNSSTFNATTGSQRNPQDIKDFANEWGLADYHRTHQFAATFNYDLPFGRGREFFGDIRGWKQALLGDWQLNGIIQLQSGRPWTPIFATVDTGGGRPDVISDPMENIPEGFFFNPFAFVHPVATTEDPTEFGSAGRNLVIGPDFKSVDLSLFKNLRFTERVKVQLRWEVFNVLNRPNFQLIGNLIPNDIGTPAFDTIEEIKSVSNVGRPTTTRGDAREMQFAVRIIF